MPKYIEGLNECTDPVAGDMLWIVDASAPATDKDRRVDASKFGLVSAPNQWSRTQQFYARAGARATKNSIAASANVVAFGLGLQSYGSVSGSFLITLSLSGTGRLATQTYLVTMAYSSITVTKLSEALFAFSSVTLYASANTSTGAMTFTINQSNPGAEAVSCNFDVLPLLVGVDGFFGLSVA